MSDSKWTVTDCGEYIEVRAPNGGCVEMRADDESPHSQFAYFALKMLLTDRDAYRASSEIRGANLTDIQAVLKELSAYFAGTALDCRNMARKLRNLERASLDCSP